MDKWVIKCPAVELLKAMDGIFEVCYYLEFGKELISARASQHERVRRTTISRWVISCSVSKYLT